MAKAKTCLMLADDMIRNSLTDLTRRPSALFLIGDQIYADDVAEVLIKHLTHFGMKLVGYEESINGSDRKLADISIGDRQWLVRKLAKFTSENAGNHLLSFGEFAAMYLITWNDENWPEFSPSNIKKSDAQKRNLRLKLNDWSERVRRCQKSAKSLPMCRLI
jgi:hypothetical protein